MTGFSEDAATPYRAGLDKASFFAWVQRQEGGRYELKDGAIVMHAGSTQAHARLSSRFTAALTSKLDPDRWIVTTADFAVEVGDDVRYPDTLVAPLGGAANDMSTSEPILLVEVLSPSSVARDMTMKLAEYTSLISLQCSIVASQDEPIVWVWQRDPETSEFPKFATEIAGRDAQIDVASLGIGLPLAEIYRGIAEVKAR